MKLPTYAKRLLKKARYKVLYGGRGGAKSETVARLLLARGMKSKRRILCGREFQNSIRESVHKLLSIIIESDEALKGHYRITENSIRGINGTEFIFKGLRHNYREIKSTADIDICWVEEAEVVSEISWRTLIPTVRNKGSEIWLTWNPEDADSPTNKRFRQNPPPNTKIVQLNYRDNPWFPKELEAVVERMIRKDKGKRYSTVLQVWLDLSNIRTHRI